MRKMRFLVVLAAMLLSSGIAVAQDVKGDVNKDSLLTTDDVPALADSIMANSKDLRLDVNGDSAVNVADVTALITLIQEAEKAAEAAKPFFWLGNNFPYQKYLHVGEENEIEGLIRTYTSLDEAMKEASREYTATEYAVVIYPESWGKKDDLVFYDATNKKYYAVKKKDVADFPEYIYYESAVKIGVATTITLSTKAEAEAAGAKLYEVSTPTNTPTNTPTETTPTETTPTETTPNNPVVTTEQAVYTGGNGIRFVIKNTLGVEARFSGKVILQVSKNPNDWDNKKQVNANMHGPQSGSSWAYNDIIIPAGGSYTSPVITTIDGAMGEGTNYTDGSWYFLSYDKDRDNGAHAIFLYTRIWQKSKNSSSGTNHMYGAVPLKNTKLLRGYTYYLTLNWINPRATLDPDQSGHYVILGKGKTGL